MRTLIIATASLLLGACGVTTVDTSCTAFRTLTYSAAGDTEVTKAQIRGHNAAFRNLCGP